MNKLNKFRVLGLSEESLEAVVQKGFEEPTEIQTLLIPKLLASQKDIVGQAQTGTGKTAAFGLPIMQNMRCDKTVQVLVLTPTRELALQVSEELSSLKGKKKIIIVPIYGGQSIEEQFRRLRKGAEIIVGTPGRIVDHLHRKTIDLSRIDVLVIDEADEMLNMGFMEEMEEILKHTNPEKRTLMFSATIPKRILKTVNSYMKDYELIKIDKDQLTTSLTEQIYFEVREGDKAEALCRIIDFEDEFYGLIFCRTKKDVDTLTKLLSDRGYDVDGLHGDITQAQREKILSRFKRRQINLLVASDVAARGLDVFNLSHVINFSLPQDPESYVHRIGRTGRAGKTGTAVTFVTPYEYRKLLFIKNAANAKIEKAEIPEVVEIMREKRKRLDKELEKAIQKDGDEEYSGWADELVLNYGASRVIAALLRSSFEKYLDASVYGEIKRGKSGKKISVDDKGTTRLFISIGKKDGITPKKLAHLIMSVTKIQNRHLNDVEVFDLFSFVTVPFSSAEEILKKFNVKIRGRKASVSRAKDKKKKSAPRG
ncbi:DEAD/DEAH box helicase [candidate division WOR-3 bacterium]|nr:DEAD/DEAH box helicase [candidate division WOR-3 bacterium]